MAEGTTSAAISGPTTAYSRKNPFLAELTRHEHLTKPGSLKDTRHFVVNLSGSGLTYTPGDSLGVFGRNPPALVNELISLIDFAPDTKVNNRSEEHTSELQSRLH